MPVILRISGCYLKVSIKKVKGHHDMTVIYAFMYSHGHFRGFRIYSPSRTIICHLLGVERTLRRGPQTQVSLSPTFT